MTTLLNLAMKLYGLIVVVARQVVVTGFGIILGLAR